MFQRLISVAFLVLWGPSALAEQPSAKFALQSDLDHVWVVTAAALVFLMQIGFMLLEAGSVRSKNSVNVAQKNLIDFILSGVCFGGIGYMFMFGVSGTGWFGWDSQLAFFGSAGDWSLTFFLFQLMFCGTAATIVSGAVAERMAINGYLICTIMIGLVIYPVSGHWVWGNLLNGDNEPLLASIGFLDFAGSTVVHSVGAWVALAAAIIIGPRIGKYDENGKPIILHGHSPILATSGAVLLWVGWIGFNGGSTLAGQGSFATIIVNTVVAGAAGGVTLMVIGRFMQGVFRPEASINGVLGGLVSITAGPDLMSTQASFLIGMCGGVVVYAGTEFLEKVLKVDDPVGAIPVHGFAGIFGTLAVAIFAPADALPAGSKLGQLWIQFQGIALIFVWAFGTSFALLKLIDAVLRHAPGGGGHGLRVPEEYEREGLNVTEHNAPMGSGLVQAAMLEVINNPKGKLRGINLEKGDDAYETAMLYNQIMDIISAERDEEEERNKSDRDLRMQFESEISDVIEACARGDYSKRLALGERAGFLKHLGEGINDLCDTTEGAMKAICRSLDAVAEGHLDRRMEGHFSGTLGDIQSSLHQTLDVLSGLVDEVEHAVGSATSGDFRNTVDLAGKTGFFERISTELNQLLTISEQGLSDLFDTLSAIGDGDLRSEMPKGYEGRFGEIGEAVDAMTTGISNLINSTKSEAQQVLASGDEIARLNRDIRARSEQQAESVTESDKLIREVADVAAETSKSLSRANDICRAAADKAEEGRDRARETSAQMEEMMAATESIGAAVKLIEDIATQTTMLSLNASVEAMRGSGAGGPSEGFKVVAQEVRSLATQTADVAGQIREKSDTVRDNVVLGAELVSQTRESLREIARSMEETSGLVEELTTTGQAQTDRTAQVRAYTDAISQSATDNLDFARKTEALSTGLTDVTSLTVANLDKLKCRDDDMRKVA